MIILLCIKINSKLKNIWKLNLSLKHQKLLAEHKKNKINYAWRSIQIPNGNYFDLLEVVLCTNSSN